MNLTFQSESFEIIRFDKNNNAIRTFISSYAVRQMISFTRKTTKMVDKSCSLNLLRWNDVPRTSRTFCPKIASIFSVLSIFKCNPGKTNDNFNNFYPVISYRRVQKEKKATNYCIRYGHSLWSANQVASARGQKIFSIISNVRINAC